MSPVPDTLARIGAYKLEHIAACKAALPYAEIAAHAEDAPPVRGFLGALETAAATSGLGLIAEIKKASPSKGLIRADFDPPALRAHRRAELSGLGPLSRRRTGGVRAAGAAQGFHV